MVEKKKNFNAYEILCITCIYSWKYSKYRFHSSLFFVLVMDEGLGYLFCLSVCWNCQSFSIKYNHVHRSNFRFLRPYQHQIKLINIEDIITTFPYNFEKCAKVQPRRYPMTFPISFIVRILNVLQVFYALFQIGKS